MTSSERTARCQALRGGATESEAAIIADLAAKEQECEDLREGRDNANQAWASASKQLAAKTEEYEAFRADCTATHEADNAGMIAAEAQITQKDETIRLLREESERDMRDSESLHAQIAELREALQDVRPWLENLANSLDQVVPPIVRDDGKTAGDVIRAALARTAKEVGK